MRASEVLLLLPLVLAAQSPRPAGLVTGTLLERDPQTASGQFSIRAAGDQVFRYLFDAQTQVERDQQAIDVARLRPGEKVDVLSDEPPGAVLRYARSIHVLTESPVVRSRPSGRGRADRDSLDRIGSLDRVSLDRIFPAGTLTFSGVVFGLNSQRVMIHTRDAGNQTILLRADTRYFEDGALVQAGDLKPNMRVFVRAGRTLYDEIEAYQVIWGQILLPR